MKSVAKRHQPPVSLGWLVTMTVAVFYLYEYYLRVMPSSMLHYFIGSFGASITDIGRIDTAYYWTYVPLQILVGTVMDIFGVRKPLFLALVSCLVGSILFSFDSLNYIIIGRALIGFGSAFGFVAVLKAASVWLPEKHFPIAIGIATAMGMLGAIFGKVFTTTMIHSVGVKHLLEITTQFSIALAIISYFLVYDRQIQNKKSTIKRRISSMKKTLVAVLTKPQVWLIGFIGLFLYLPTQIFGLWDIEFFAVTRGLPPTTAAKVAAYIYWGWIVGGPLTGYISGFLERKSNLMLIGAIGMLGCLYLIIYTSINHIILLSSLMFLLGVFSSSQILVFDFATHACNSSHAGTAIAITNMIVMFGGFLQNLVAYLIQSNSIEGYASINSFQTAFMILPIGLTITFILILFVKNPTHPE
ncbi:MFS transporter [Gammaproteobacteria bacterium]|nr:MFS transporter [Gammaproteobacteria bacterium]